MRSEPPPSAREVRAPGNKIAVLQPSEGANVLWRKCAVPAAATGGLRDNGGDEKRKNKIKQNQYSKRRARQLDLSSVWTLSSGSAIKATDV